MFKARTGSDDIDLLTRSKQNEKHRRYNTSSVLREFSFSAFLPGARGKVFKPPNSMDTEERSPELCGSGDESKHKIFLLSSKARAGEEY